MVPPKFERHCGQSNAIRNGQKRRELSQTISTTVPMKVARVVRLVRCHLSWFRVIQIKGVFPASSELTWPSRQKSLGDKCKKTSRICRRGEATLSPQEPLTTFS